LFPLRDLNRSLTTPHVTRLILIANVVIFTVYWLSSQNILLNDRFAGDIEKNFTMIPRYIVRGQRIYTLFTSMFMHAGWIHLIGNMLYLYIFGDNVEDTFGHAGYLILYFVCGLAASFTYIMSLTSSQDYLVGVVGASGAISGVLGAYVVLYPKSKILTLVFYGLPIIIAIPAILFLGFWFVLQWLYQLLNIEGGVAYWAHIGGFTAGMILALAFGLRRKKAREARRRL
jgi:membrane associated rhomboid family serine protease